MPKKRANSNIYEKKVTLGRDENGKPIRVSVYASSKLDLEQKAFELKQDYLTKTNTVTNEMTFKSYAQSWFNTYKAVRSINTRAMYQNVIDKHLIPVVGDMYFSSLTDMKVLQSVINSNKEHPETCKKIKVTLVQIFDQAVRDKLIEVNHMRELSLPPVVTKKKRALTDSEKKLLVSHEWDAKQKAFLYIAYYTGARREEILALQRSDFDFERLFVSYDKTIVYDKGNAVLVHATKAEASTRNVPLPTAAVEFLKEYTKDMKSDSILFPMKSGGYMSLSSYTKFWNGIRDVFVAAYSSSADLTAHMLRHNYATMLYYSGITMKKAAQLLGHANTNMIMKIYAHLDEEKEDSLGKLNQVFG